MKTIEERIAKRIKKDVLSIIIEDQEHRENANGKNLQPGSPVYYLDNCGVYGEENKEFAGWVINGRFYLKINV